MLQDSLDHGDPWARTANHHALLVDLVLVLLMLGLVAAVFVSPLCRGWTFSLSFSLIAFSCSAVPAASFASDSLAERGCH